MENIEIYFNDVKEALNNISKTIKELDIRLRSIEIEINNKKIYYAFLECNYTLLIEMIEKYKSEKQLKKDINANILKNVTYSILLAIINLVGIGAISLLLKLIK